MSRHTVTGAFGYSGKYIAARLLAAGREVATLTDSPERRNPFGDRVQVSPYNFDHPAALAKSLEGTEVLYNTYWVRFNHRRFTHHEAVDNSRTLFAAARQAGVRRIVHVSITNPSVSSELEYFRGKALLERALIESGVSYAILRPAVLFGFEDILINNIAWALRRLPVFGVFGNGEYRLQPIHVEDLARLAVERGDDSTCGIEDAVGPETYTYRNLVATIGAIIGRNRPIIGVPPWFGYAVSTLVGSLVGDIFITREEIAGLMSGLLEVSSKPTGSIKLSEWATANANTLGIRYASELGRRRDRRAAYGEI